MDKEDKIRTTVFVTSNLDAWWRAIALQRGVTKTEVFQEALCSLISKEGFDPKKQPKIIVK